MRIFTILALFTSLLLMHECAAQRLFDLGI